MACVKSCIPDDCGQNEILSHYVGILLAETFANGGDLNLQKLNGTNL